MLSDVIISRELKSLQEEALSGRRDRPAAPAAQPAPSPPSPAEAAEEAAEERQLRDQLGNLVSEVTDFFEEAEKSIAAHPAQSLVGALLAGILIGRLLGRH
jgi:ElaB/YqjD/DUF883 family membrane-anchored ribosome-binding protein